MSEGTKNPSSLFATFSSLEQPKKPSNRDFPTFIMVKDKCNPGREVNVIEAKFAKNGTPKKKTAVSTPTKRVAPTPQRIAPASPRPIKVVPPCFQKRMNVNLQLRITPRASKDDDLVSDHNNKATSHHTGQNVNGTVAHKDNNEEMNKLSVEREQCNQQILTNMEKLKGMFHDLYDQQKNLIGSIDQFKTDMSEMIHLNIETCTDTTKVLEELKSIVKAVKEDDVLKDSTDYEKIMKQMELREDENHDHHDEEIKRQEVSFDAKGKNNKGKNKQQIKKENVKTADKVEKPDQVEKAKPFEVEIKSNENKASHQPHRVEESNKKKKNGKKGKKEEIIHVEDEHTELSLDVNEQPEQMENIDTADNGEKENDFNLVDENKADQLHDHKSDHVEESPKEQAKEDNQEEFIDAEHEEFKRNEMLFGAHEQPELIEPAKPSDKEEEVQCKSNENKLHDLDHEEAVDHKVEQVADESNNNKKNTNQEIINLDEELNDKEVTLNAYEHPEPIENIMTQTELQAEEEDFKSKGKKNKGGKNKQRNQKENAQAADKEQPEQIENDKAEDKEEEEESKSDLVEESNNKKKGKKGKKGKREEINAFDDDNESGDEDDGKRGKKGKKGKKDKKDKKEETTNLLEDGGDEIREEDDDDDKRGKKGKKGKKDKKDKKEETTNLLEDGGDEIGEDDDDKRGKKGKKGKKDKKEETINTGEDGGNESGDEDDDDKRGKKGKKGNKKDKGKGKRK